MKSLIRTTSSLLILLAAVACQNPKNQQPPATAKDTTTQSPGANQTSLPSAQNLEGDYTNPDYDQRQKGYDWVAVRVRALNDSTLHISVRSRADQKKPTCTFDAKAQRSGAGTYVSQANGFNVTYRFTNNQLRIAPGEGMDKDALQYFCSGGGNFSGLYQKTTAPLDESQVDQRVFVKALNWQKYFFDISTTGAGSLSQLTLNCFGLTKGKFSLKKEVVGQVIGAETEDLDADGFPEVLVYVESAGSGSYGEVLGYSVQKGQSLVPIAFPPLEQNQEAAKGYGGHDEFALVEQSLVRRFPTYNTGDAQAKPTGLLRQIQYKLVKLKNGPAFVLERSSTYPAPSNKP